MRRHFVATSIGASVLLDFAAGYAMHWAENRGSVPAVWIAVDIPKD
jgi:hypothetical protein